MKKLKGIPAGLLAAVTLIGLSIVFFSPVLFTGKLLFAGDNLSINVPSKVLFFRMLARGQLPLWNPYTFSGTPFLADINLGLLSPFNVFYFFFSPLQALTLSVITAVTIAGLGTYLYARRIKVGLWGSLASACIFMFSGSMMAHTLNTAVLNTIAWLPLIFYLLATLFETKNLKYSLLTSVVLSFSLFGGHIQYFYYILLFTLSYILIQPINFKRKLVYVAYIYIPALFLTAVQWVPFLQYASYSTRPAQSLSYAGSVSPVSFIQLILPNFFGIAKDGTSWGATADINGYIGIIPLILAISSFFGKKSRALWFLIISVLITLFLALGSRSPLYLFAFYVLPFFARFRSPAGILIVYTFCMAILSGIALERLKNIKFGLFILFGSLVLFIVSILTGNKAQQLILPMMMKLNHLKKTAFITRFLEYSPARAGIIFSLWFENLAVVFFSVFSFVLASIAYTRRITSVSVYRFVLFFLIVSDLFFFAGNNMITANPGSLQSPNEITAFLKEDQSPYRIITYPDPGAKPPFADPGYFVTEAQKALDILHPNTNIFSRAEAVGGYASIVRKDFAAYLSPVKASDPTGITLPLPGSLQIDELNVKYILTAGSQVGTLSAVPYYRPVMQYRDPRINRTVFVYKNMHALPRAYLTGPSRQTINNVIVKKSTPVDITYIASSTSSSRLVLSEMVYPGWTAYVDGKPAKIEPYKGIFRSVSLTAGNHTVRFRFAPFLVGVAGLISFVNWIYMLGFLIFLLGKKHEEVGEELHIGEPEIKQDT